MVEETLRPLSDVPAINRFLSYCRVRTIPGKTVMIHAGDLPDVLYYIVDGSVEVMIEDEDGNEIGAVIAMHNFGAGDIIEIQPPEGGALMLPFNETVVPEVDIKGGRIVAVLPGEIEAKEEE